MQRRSVDLLESEESAELTGRISPLDSPCALSWREATFGESSVRLFSADAHRYERTATFGAAHPRRVALMVVGQGRLRGRFGARDVDLERGAALITDTIESAFYECSDRLRILGTAVDAGVLGALSRGPHAARLQRTTLVNSVIAFASAMFADDGDDPAAAGSVEDLDRAICELQARVLAEASAARPDDDLRTRIERYIDTHLADQALSPRRIADASRRDGASGRRVLRRLPARIRHNAGTRRRDADSSRRVAEPGLQRGSVVLHGPMEAAAFTGRITPVASPCSLSWQEVVLRRSCVRLVRADAYRFERMPALPVPHARQVAALVVGDGHVRGRFGDRAVDLHCGAALLTDSIEPTRFECTSPVRIFAIGVDADAIGTPARAPFGAKLERTPLVNGMIAFASTLFAGDADDAVTTGPTADLDRAVCDLMARVLAEALAARPDADLRTRIERYIDAHLTDQTLSPRSIRGRRVDAVADDPRSGDPAAVGELALRYGFGSRDQLARGFRERFGRSVGEFRASGPDGIAPV